MSSGDTIYRITADACQAANQADADCTALELELEDLRARHAILRAAAEAVVRAALTTDGCAIEVCTLRGML